MILANSLSLLSTVLDRKFHRIKIMENGQWWDIPGVPGTCQQCKPGELQSSYDLDILDDRCKNKKGNRELTGEIRMYQLKR